MIGSLDNSTLSIDVNLHMRFYKPYSYVADKYGNISAKFDTPVVQKPVVLNVLQHCPVSNTT